MFAVNPLGVQEDGVWSDGVAAGAAGGPSAGGRFDATIDLNPDYVYESRGRVTERGYEVEVRIPFKSLRYQSADPQDWGIQLVRSVQHSGYEETWTPAVRANASFLIQSGRLVGLGALQRGLLLDLTPEFTTKVDGAPTTPRYDYRGTPEVAGNLRWGVTQNLGLTATAHPDFSQVEADIGQVTLNQRFALFYPEKRPFFLEGLERSEEHTSELQSQSNLVCRLLLEKNVCRLFVPLVQGYTGQTFLHVRLNTQDRHAVAAFIPTLRQTLREIDPDLPLLQITPFLDLMERSPNLWIVKLGATLFGAFGAIALMLAVVGLYGVKAYAVACRTREIGIRMALGAHRRDVFALIMRQGAMQTALAVGAGLLLSLGAGRILAKILYDVSPSDPLALVTATLMLASAALLACFFPANRATRVDPMTALRTE